MKDCKIIVRGGGDLATGTIHRLWAAGFKVLVLECEMPSAIRRQVSVCEAVYEEKIIFENMQSVRIYSIEEAMQVWAKDMVPVLVDAEGKCIDTFKPDIVIDAIIAKKNMGTNKNMAPLTIALGPGFIAGKDVDFVVETKRGHNLGRIITDGMAAPNSGIPGNIGGYTTERVVHAPATGILHIIKDIGSLVKQGETIAVIKESREHKVQASITGIIRGMIKNGYQVTEGLKIADIDPREEELSNCFTISDKARCIAGSVLEIVCSYVMEKYNG